MRQIALSATRSSIPGRLGQCPRLVSVRKESTFVLAEIAGARDIKETLSFSRQLCFI